MDKTTKICGINPDWVIDDVDTVEKFLDRYYKPDRYRGRGEEYAKALLESHEKDFNERGYDLISHYDCVTGKPVCLMGRVVSDKAKLI